MKPQCLFYLALIFLFGSLRAQTLNYMPPNPGGFEVLVSGKYLPTTDEYLTGSGKASLFPTNILQTNIYGQYAFSSRNLVFAAKLPVYHRIRQEFRYPNGVHKVDAQGFSNAEIAMRYLIRKPEILGNKKFLLGEARVLFPPSAKRDSIGVNKLGYDGFGLETGLFGGVSTDKWHAETGFQLGMRPNYSNYLTAYGKLGRQFNSFQWSLTLHARQPLKAQEGNDFGTFTGMIYRPRQQFLILGTEIIWFRSRFLGFGLSASRVMLGEEILLYNAFGGGVYVKWN